MGDKVMTRGYPSAEEIAEKIRYIHEATFAGKPRGRFKIEDELMRELSGRLGRLQDNTFEDIKNACAEEGLMITRLKHHKIYTVIETKKMVGWRNVPARILAKLEKDWESDD
ncbi:hypothetical protein ALP45_01946 [Pseudomonas coronafaciens pv. atropurpurea]|uniref:hypothetical protein n=1 Tax=Pseudomonas coronafaciens TaxID=53409 RepID=UPI0006D6309E|nr:hypothetical protein [Pseudomonas coronafaciens]KPW40596.1 Unknown protein sequence [Pseudomonas coronafaciens pv. atropurpurea]RMT63712.1 hypothetical protein ALP45_01946 [Pseudomonas coronafaciens pv. atropurpurea]